MRRSIGGALPVRAARAAWTAIDRWRRDGRLSELWPYGLLILFVGGYALTAWVWPALRPADGPSGLVAVPAGFAESPGEERAAPSGAADEGRGAAAETAVGKSEAASGRAEAAAGRPDASSGRAEAGPEIVVDVKGAVARPGVYRLPAGARVFEALEAAGGLLPEADVDRVNRAAVLADGVVVNVPKKGEAAEAGGSSPAGSDAGLGAAGRPAKVNLNTADAALLQTLPGIGPTRAQAIIAYREEHGPFRDVTELKNVSGIGPKTLERLLPYVTVGP
ncbi:helix-hairpin-helix domain-containing protein [Hydrogenibacillus sp. N12]|uniref:helix-hairpin-helix domain-containing protein n=1 Tax=Hydrogenibacillus sp. N12 TaxID=2866627 RepID=UPI001C7D1418|nr:helix-hairpin-helix domain-containing protein [Hydrogenibacillus sp. N12]QZA33387.1 helix-hairpin-helix domain-containing protein [Hydrogenibacillus sp. N12]